MREIDNNVSQNTASIGVFGDLNSFITSKIIAKGSSGKLYFASHVHTKKEFVIKSARIRTDEYDDLKREIDILTSIEHENIISVRSVSEKKTRLCMVMDFMDGGDLLQDLYKKKRYKEPEARSMIKEILKGIRFLHKNNIVHRDIKLENILIDKYGGAKITDFGLSTRILRPYSLTTRCGTPGWTAPEILLGVSYGEEVDIWGIGIILFTMLGGYHPFDEQDDEINDALIMKGYYVFHNPYWRSISFDGKQFVKDLLTLIPTSRPTSHEAMLSLWLKSNEGSE